MSCKSKLLFVYFTISLFLLNTKYLSCNENITNPQYKLVKGRISEIDYNQRKINLLYVENLKIQNETINTDGTLKKIDENLRIINLNNLYKGMGVLLRYNTKDKCVVDLWILNNVDDPYDTINYVLVREKGKNNIVHSFYIGTSDEINAYYKNQIHILLNGQYLGLLNNLEDKKVKIDATLFSKEGRKFTLQLRNQELEGNQLLSSVPIIFDFKELGVINGDIIKIKITLRQKRQNQTTSKEKWVDISSREVRIQTKDFGLMVYPSDTISFVKNSFGNEWKPAPGVSVSVGGTFLIRQETCCLSRGFKNLWNMLDPRFGINLTLLDFDNDISIEYGFGWTISILKGGIFFGRGLNLSTKRNNKDYGFFGISITKIAEKIKGKL